MKVTISRACPKCEYQDKKNGRATGHQLHYLKANPLNQNQQCPKCQNWGLMIEVVKEKLEVKKIGEPDFIPGREKVNDIWKFSKQA